MKRIFCIFIAMFLLNGCGTTTSEMDAAVELRQKLLVNSCSFVADITADYGDELYNFRVQCSADASGNMNFTVIAPDTISGITGCIDRDNAKLTFDDTVLSFPPLSDGKLAPAMAPWVFINTLRSGFLSACGKNGDLYLILADDSYADNALKLEIWADPALVPVSADIFWNQQRIVSIQISDFIIQ